MPNKQTLTLPAALDAALDILNDISVKGDDCSRMALAIDILKQSSALIKRAAAQNEAEQIKMEVVEGNPDE